MPIIRAYISTTCLLILILTTVPTTLVGQSLDDRAPRRFSFILDVGLPLGGPAHGLAAQLRQAGFDDPTGCFIFCTGIISHPSEHGGAGAFALTARFAISSAVVVGAGYRAAELGGSNGFRKTEWVCVDDMPPCTPREGVPRGFLFSRWSGTTVWAGAFWRPALSTGVRIGAGPAWHSLTTWTAAGRPGETDPVSRVGLMGEVGFELPSDRRFFWDIAVRIHLVPTKDVEHPVRGAPPITMRPNWTYAQLLVGFGVHL